jgi:hypothetical protein
LSKVGDLGVDPRLLFLETCKGGGEDLIRQFCGHVDKYRSGDWLVRK